MLTPFDDYPIHQTPLPIAHPASGDPNHYDRFWFNGYTEDYYFAAGMAVYPNRGIIDGAFAVVHDGVQRSVFASGRIPEDRRETRIGPLTIEIVEPLRVTRGARRRGRPRDRRRRHVHRPHGRARRAAPDDHRRHEDRDGLDPAHAVGNVVGRASRGRRRDGARSIVYGTKDRSWGVRPVGEPTPAPRPTDTLPQIFFLWAPINWDDCCTHFLCFERGERRPLRRQPGGARRRSATATRRGAPTTSGIEHLAGTVARRALGAGPAPLARARRSACCATTAPRRRIELEPLLTFRMRGLGYTHPSGATRSWHGEHAVGSEEHKVEELDNLEPWNIHIQQVMRARCGDRVGLGVLEQLAFGEHTPERPHRHPRRLHASLTRAQAGASNDQRRPRERFRNGTVMWNSSGKTSRRSRRLG